MSKEKKQIEKEKTKDFFYEITATIIILLCLVTLSELGSVGVILKKTFKVMFGDFYFVVIIYLIAHGIYALVKQKWFNFKSLRFNGFLLFIANLLLLVHISFLELYGIASRSVLSNTLDIYKAALFSGEKIESYGGGILGAILAQIFVVLFNRIGAIIIGIIFIIMSISFMTNLNFKSLLYGITFLSKKIKSIWLNIYHYFANINYPSKKDKIKKRNYLVNLNLLNDIPNNPNDLLQSKISFEEKRALLELFYQSNCFVNSDKMYIGYSQTRYIFYGAFHEMKENRIDSLLNRKVLFYLEKNRLIIEAPNKIKKLLSLKSLLMLNLEYSIPLGVELSDTIIYFNPLVYQNLLISGEKGSGIKTFLKAFIVTLIYRLKEKFSLIICDYEEEFIDLKYLPNLFFPISRKPEKLDEIFDSLTYELEKRLVMLEEYNVSDYLSLNEMLASKKIEPIKPIFMVINTIDSFRRSGYDLDQKLLYFLKFGYKAGIHLLLISRMSGVSPSIISNTKTKILLKTSLMDQSFEILSNKNACALVGNGDALLIHELTIYHLQLPYLSDSDYHRVLSKYILN